MNAVIYCRVSSKEQVEGTSLESQEFACKEYASRNHLDVVRVFVERGESAKFADRTQLLELMAFCAKRDNRVERLLVWKVDRLARNVGDHFNIKAGLLKHNIRVISVTEPIDANPEGRLLETILAGFAQFDNDLRAARTLQGMRRKIQDGLFPWKPPFGYRGARQPGNKKTEPDLPDQPTFGLLQQAWKEFATGRYTKADILRMVSRRGLRTRAGKPVPKQTLDDIFRDPFYAGTIRDPWSGEEHVGRHLPMISRETFAKVQQVTALRNRSVPHKIVRTEFPLRVFVRCAACGRSFTGSISRGRSSTFPYYRCFNGECTSHQSYPIEVVHREFTDFLDAESAARSSLDRLKRYVEESFCNRTANDRELAEKRAADLGRIKRQQSQLIQMKMNQMLTDEEFMTQRSLLSARVHELEAVETEDPVEVGDVVGAVESICEPLMDLGGEWTRIPTEFKLRFQQLLLPSGYTFGRVGTAQKGRLFSLIGTSTTLKPALVPLTSQSWNQLVEEITAFAQITREASEHDQAA